MTIENPEKFVQCALNARDFTTEQHIGTNDELLQRRDGVRIWARQSRTLHDSPNYTIGMDSGHCIFKVTFSKKPEDSQYHAIKATVGIPVRIEWNTLFVNWEYRVNSKWIKEKTGGGSHGFSHRKKSILSKLEAIHKTGSYWQRKDLPAHINLEETGDRFLTKILGWVRDPSSFEKADIKPELVPEG
jgi:hypothetical protein